MHPCTPGQLIICVIFVSRLLLAPFVSTKGPQLVNCSKRDSYQHFMVSVTHHTYPPPHTCIQAPMPLGMATKHYAVKCQLLRTNGSKSTQTAQSPAVPVSISAMISLLPSSHRLISGMSCMQNIMGPNREGPKECFLLLLLLLFVCTSMM